MLRAERPRTAEPARVPVARRVVVHPVTDEEAGELPAVGPVPA
ncbi:hypothetical protein [Streptomyces sp. NPDC054940]